MSTNIIPIDDKNIMDELNLMVRHKKDYMDILKKNFKHNNIGIKKKDIITIQFNKNGEELIFKGFPLHFYTQEDENTFTFNIDIYDNEILKFRKQLMIPKIVNIDEHIENIDMDIHNQNLFIKMKNIMDKINKINTVGDNNTFIQENGEIYDHDHLEEILSDYRREYVEIKNVYSDLINKRTTLLTIKNNLYKSIDSELNTLHQKKHFIELNNRVLYNEIKEDETKIVEYLEQNRILKDFEESEKKFSCGLNNTSCIDMDIDYNPIEFDNINVNKFIDTIQSNIIITKHFKGSFLENKNSMDDNINKPVKNIYENIELHIENISDLDAELGIDQTTRFIIGGHVNSMKPGKGNHETIKIGNINIFSKLEEFGDWRRKLSDVYIDKSGINNIPIIIDGQYFSSISHYCYYLLFNNREDVSGELKLYYQEFADNLLLNKNGIHSKKNKKNIDSYIHSHKLIIDPHSKCNLKKGYYAKYIQNLTFNKLLKYTHNSLLIYEQDNKYYANIDLMYVRDLIIKNDSPDTFYKNAENDIQLFNKLGKNNNQIPIDTFPLGGLWVDKYLPNLRETIHFPKYNYNIHIIPSDNKLWIDSQKRYYENYTNDKTKEMIQLMIMKSMKLFNNVVDTSAIQTNIQSKFSKDELRYFVEEIKKYVNYTPKNNNKIIVYSGIDRVYYENIKSEESFKSKRFMSATFNKEYANHYSSLIGTEIKPGRGYYSKINNKPFIVYNITIPTNYNKIFYFEQENQVIFLPGVLFRKQKDNEIRLENVSRIEGDTRKRNKILIENVFYELVSTNVEELPPFVEEETIVIDLSDTEEETKSPIIDLDLKSEYNEQIRLLKEKGLYKKGMTRDEISNQLLQLTISAPDSILSQITKLQKIADDNNFEVIDIPPDGDCAYYTITHGLQQHQVKPMDFDINDTENEYSGTKRMAVRYGNGEYKQPILVNATIKIRQLLADKLVDNLENPTDTLKTMIEGVLPGLINNEEKLNEYIDSIRYMVNSTDQDKKGDWGDMNSFILASALFRVNFNIYSDGIEPIKINSERTQIDLPYGNMYNDDFGIIDYIIPTINIGYYMGNHYVLLKHKIHDQIGKGNSYLEEDNWEQRHYHITDVEYNDTKYQIVFYIDHYANCVERTVGIYDKDMETWDQGNDENIWIELSKKAIDEYDNATKHEKIFYIDISNNYIFNPSKENPVGKLVKYIDGTFYIDFNDSSIQ